LAGNPSVVTMEGAFSELRDKVYPPWEKALEQIRTAARLLGLNE
jgi:hypothetical protein